MFRVAKKVEVHVNICDWDFKIHHVVWVYNTTYKIATNYSPFHLTYGMEALLPIELELMSLHIATWWDFPWMNPNAINYCNLINELDELQLKAHQSIRVA